MVAKRALFPPSEVQLAKRLRRVERIAKNNRPEMKHITWASTGAVAAGTLVNIELTRVAQGSGINQRIGDRIKIWRIEVRGVADGLLDNHILQGHTTTAPGFGSFGTGAGAFLLDSETNTRFTEWKYYRNPNIDSINDPQHYVVKFKNGMVCKFNNTASTGAVDNKLYLTHINHTGSSLNRTVSVRMWYTDA